MIRRTNDRFEPIIPAESIADYSGRDTEGFTLLPCDKCVNDTIECTYMKWCKYEIKVGAKMTKFKEK